MATMTYDAEADAVYIAVGQEKVMQSRETAPGVILDLDVEGRIVGIEVINASRRLAPGDWKDIAPPANDAPQTEQWVARGTKSGRFVDVKSDKAGSRGQAKASGSPSKGIGRAG